MYRYLINRFAYFILLLLMGCVALCASLPEGLKQVANARKDEELTFTVTGMKPLTCTFMPRTAGALRN